MTTVHKADVSTSYQKCFAFEELRLRNGCLDKVSNDGKIGIVSKGNNLLVDHKSKDTQHGGTAVVELDGTLGKLGLLVEVIPSEVDVSVTEVTDEVTRLG
eukprot:CAMPEP_0201601606 /NCGR_PEP_ID=MMETSP0492-20130828/2537_1 /ASSEMBLY_ACC=CAM_ASM_000837 /TAXON_ID=420259 /ORGANISM="Thalassiosira gravida, Strain GMp14c1" /LENGTH=99 /DNA_ID=CAMNT_0048064887 /DNA_START=199 /DNA_END=494 /DNA_ORIENTATION=-